MRRFKKLGKSMFAGIVAMAMVVSSITITPKHVAAAVYAERGAFGVGVGKQIPDHIFAPFVDIVSYVSDKDYSSGGTLSLEQMYKDTGILYYNLGFIMTNSSGGGVKNGVLDWAWGGYSSLTEEYGGDGQMAGMKESIEYIRSKGGDVIISIGGLNEGNFFQATQDEDILFNSYMDVIQGYGLTRLDLDIEGGGQGKQINIANAKALKRVQDATGVEIVLTLPVLPSGLTDLGLGTFEAYVENGVDVKMVNIMAMCYGDATLNPGETYATASNRAIDSTAQQILSTYQNNGKSISRAEAYAKVGVTVSIGFESASFPIWTPDYSRVVNEKSIQENIGMTSFWCLNRDCQQYGENKGITGMYDHTNIFKTFMGENAYQIPAPSKDDGYEYNGQLVKPWKASTAYQQDDLVTYNGQIWKALWWTQGDTPGEMDAYGSEPWTYVTDMDDVEVTTAAPATQAPTTTEPATEAPTVAPTTEPTTQAPTTTAPVTEPSTQTPPWQPTTEPSTQTPPWQPTTQQPVTETTTAQPATDAPQKDYTYSNNATRTELLPDSKLIGNTTYVDLVKATSARVAASSQHTNENGTNMALYAIDEDAGSRWESEQGSDNEYIMFDLIQPQRIREIGIIWEAAAAKDYKIQVSNDGLNFQDVAVLENAASVQNRLDVITWNQTVSARYVKIQCVSRALPYGYSIYDLAIYGEGSIEPTTAWQQPTEAPMQPTTIWQQPTDASTQPTTAWQQPTDAPMQPTAWQQPTDAPTQPTVWQQPTDAPTQPTAWQQPTDAPTQPTTAWQQPTEPTTGWTPVQVVPTKADSAWGYDPSRLNYSSVPSSDGSNVAPLPIALVNTSIEGLVPSYGNGGNTLTLRYNDPNALGSTAKVTVNDVVMPQDAVTLRANGQFSINPNALPDNAYSEIKIELQNGQTATLVIKKGNPTAPQMATTAAGQQTTAVQQPTGIQPTAAGEQTTAADQPTGVQTTEVQQPTGTETTTGAEQTTAAATTQEALTGDAKALEDKIISFTNDNEPASATFRKLRAQVKKKTTTSNKVTWKKQSGATKYVIFGGKCGTKYTRLATTTAASYNHTGLAKGTYYKYLVVAINNDGKVLAISRLIHAATKGGKVGNAKAVKLNKKKVTLKKGKKFKVKATQTADIKKAKIKNHRKISFESSNTKVATVSGKGVIKAKGKGKCTVYVFAQNGVYKKVAVNVK